MHIFAYAHASNNHVHVACMHMLQTTMYILSVCISCMHMLQTTMYILSVCIFFKLRNTRNRRTRLSYSENSRGRRTVQSEESREVRMNLSRKDALCACAMMYATSGARGLQFVLILPVPYSRLDKTTINSWICQNLCKVLFFCYTTPISLTSICTAICCDTTCLGDVQAWRDLFKTLCFCLLFYSNLIWASAQSIFYSNFNHQTFPKNWTPRQ
jgi:hypothetical protein